ncbi:hypothetical protein [Ureibacillus sp. GCM10028918]|uniref:hypothetical protein n=1 Tax=Ureibacillus sp. GCM10028918 TaxID=3273429 RepID=UPI0036163E0C
MKIKLLIVFLLMFPFLVNFSTTSSFACSCVVPGTTQEELDKSDFVYSGKVIEIYDLNARAIVKSSIDLLEVKFEVLDTWKGVNESEVLVYTERDSASCGVNFTINEEYLVYGNEHDGRKSVNLCSNTALLTEATDDLEALGEGQKPTKEVDLGKDTEASMDIPIIIFACISILIILVSTMLVKKVNRK